jgi:signal transduction histidine kinase
MKIVSFLYQFLISPVSEDEDGKRQEYILNILLVSASALLFCLSFILFLEQLFIHGYQGVSPITAFFAAAFFSSLLLLSRKGFSRVASYFIVGVLFAYIFYANYSWGPDLPITWILYCFLITISGILISSRFAFFITATIASALIWLTWMLNSGYLVLARGWKQTGFLWGDAVAASIAFALIAIFSWLANRDLRASLQRARVSEAALKVERDTLEIKVEERTKQLKEAQEIQLEQMTRFAEFGQLASGIMHDLANPLTSMSINLQMVKDQVPEDVRDTNKYMDQALQATKRMEELVQVARQQFQKKPETTPFILGDEIEQAVQLLQSKARPVHVSFDLMDIERIESVGSPLKFHRVVMNLLANAIEAYADSKVSDDQRLIRVTCHEDDGDAVIEIIDMAGGISGELLEKIFNPFFTTKKTGSGIGLSTVKEILLKDFSATIDVTSTKGQTVFEIRLPIRKNLT